MRKTTPTVRPLVLVAGFALLVMMASTGSQCTKVEDSVTGPLNAPRAEVGGERSDCIHECNRAMREALRAESALHNTNVHACVGNPDCLRDENARHAAALRRIHDETRDCRAACHDQGRGHGGD